MAAHPGWTFTKILGTGRLMTATVDLSRRARVDQSPADGAQAIIAAAVGLSALGGGGYAGPTGMLAGPVGAARSPRASRKPGAARALVDGQQREHAGVPTDWR